MDQLHGWLKRQLDDKLTEPNSALGGAIGYMLRHWEKLTLFLRQAGAPLDNNVCERALKKAILHRKNALFYKTQNGARVGDLFMSLIYTCHLNQVNPFDHVPPPGPRARRTPPKPPPLPISGCPGTIARHWRKRARTKHTANGARPCPSASQRKPPRRKTRGRIGRAARSRQPRPGAVRHGGS